MTIPTRSRIPRMPIIPRADLDHLSPDERLITILTERSDYTRARDLAESAYMEPQNALSSLRLMEKKGLVISRKTGSAKSSPVYFMISGAK